MYYRRSLPVFSGIYRPLPVKRYVLMALGGYWPVIQRLPGDRLGVVTRDGDFHVGERGRLVFLTSPDGGESWSHATVISGDGPDNRNPAFGVAEDGTLLAAFVKMGWYTDGEWDPVKGRAATTPMFISRSSDGGDTWSEAEVLAGQGEEEWSGASMTDSEAGAFSPSPFGKMITLPDGMLLMSYYLFYQYPDAAEAKEAVFVLRSHDGGHTWVHPVTVAEGFNETTLCHLGDGRLIAVMREARTGPQPGQSLQRTWQCDSEDGGYTWSEPRPITGAHEHPADVVRLKDGRLLLTYGRREPPYGVQGMVSRDEGRTWDAENRLLLAGDSGRDCGYPSSVQREDGAIVTVYYAHNMPSEPRMGPHGAALIYRPEDLP